MVWSRSGVVAQRVALVLLVVAPLIVLAAVPAAAAAPNPTTSYYVRSTGPASEDLWFGLGCNQGTIDANRPGTQNRIVVLDFGSPRRLLDGTYGFELPGGASGELRSRQEAQSVAVNYALGYWACTGNDRASVISLAIGTTNNGTEVASNGYQQGRAFANFVRWITEDVADGGASSQVKVRAAIDVEMDWNTFADTREWFQGYDSLSNTPIYDFGDAAGCTQDGSTTACNNGWTQERVWWVSEGFPLARPLPEIYTNSGSQARQWYQLARYTHIRHSVDMLIYGTLTQFGACQQVGGCTTTDNTPSQGWTQLYDLLNADPSVRHRPRWSADISYSTSPAAPATQTVDQPLPAEKAAAFAEHRAADGARLAATAAPAPAPPSGIVQDVNGALPTSRDELLNAWQGRVDGRFVAVYAGAQAGDPGQGVVIVVTLQDAHGAAFRQTLLRTPQRAGAVRVVSADGPVLTLRAASGATFTLDAAEGRFG
jgi:hypothetical protein